MRIAASVRVEIAPLGLVFRAMAVAVHRSQPRVLLAIVVGIGRRTMDVQPRRLDEHRRKRECHEGVGGPTHVRGV